MEFCSQKIAIQKLFSTIFMGLDGLVHMFQAQICLTASFYLTLKSMQRQVFNATAPLMQYWHEKVHPPSCQEDASADYTTSLSVCLSGSCPGRCVHEKQNGLVCFIAVAVDVSSLAIQVVYYT